MLYQTPPCLLVIGMHRSGTSVLTGCLRALGVSLGESLMPGNTYNPSGYFENNDIHAIHEQMLEQLGLRWDMVGRLPADWLDSEAAVTATKRLDRILDSQFCGRGPWAVKDPRICRVLPLWQRLLAAKSIPVCPILVVRHPEEVAASLAKRDGLDRETGRLLWLTYQREALAALRGSRYAVVTYEQILADPLSTLRSLDAFFGLELPLANAAERVLALVNPGLRHHATKEQPAPDPVADAYAWLYATLKRRQLGGSGPLEDAGILEPGQTQAAASPQTAEPSLATELTLAPVQPFAPTAQLDPSAVHGQAILTDILDMVGRYEQRERDDRLQRERAFLSAAGNPLFLAVHVPQPPNPAPGYAGESVKYCVLIPDEWNEIRVDLPSAVALHTTGMRLDPLVQQQGVVTLGALRLVHAATGEVLWAADNAQDFQACQCNEQVCVLNGQGEVRLLCMGSESQIHLPVLPALPDVPVRLTVWIKASRDTYLLRDLLAESGELRRQLDQVQAEKSNIADLGGQLQAEKSALIDQLRDQAQRAEAAEAKAAGLTEELDRIRGEKVQAPAEQTLTQSLEGARSRIQDLIQQVGTLEAEVERVQAEKNEIADFGGQLMAEKKILSNQLHDLNQRAKTAEAGAAGLTAELEQVQAEKNRIADIGGQLMAEKNAMADQIRELTQRAEATEAALERERANAAELAEELTQKVEAGEAKILDLTQQVEAAEAEKNRIADIGGQLQAEKNTLTDQIRELTQNVEAGEAKILELTQQVEAAEAEKNRIADIGGQLQAEKNTLTDQIRELTQNVEAGEAKILELTQQVEADQAALERERANAAGLTEELTQMAALLQASLGREDAMAGRLETAQTDHQAAQHLLQGRLDALQDQFLGLTRDLETSLAREETLAQRAEAVEADLAAARTHQQTLAQERDQARADTDLQTRRVAELESTLEGKHRELAAALDQAKTDRTVINALGQRLETATRYIKSLEEHGENVRTILEDKAEQLARQVGSPNHQMALQLLRSLEGSPRRMSRARADRKAFLERQIATIKERGALDTAYYETNNPDVREQQFPPVEHYVRHGWTEGRSPKAGFDDALYLLDHPDMVVSGLCPLAHALTEGGKTAPDKGSLTVLLAQRERAGNFEVELVRQSGLFDDAYYAAQHPEVPAADPNDRLRHYLTTGWKLGYRPNPWLVIPATAAAQGEFAPLVQMLLHGFVPGEAGAHAKN